MTERRDSALSSVLERVRQTVVRRQHPVSGLFPASTAVTRHGDYGDAWVRDGVYAAWAPWAVARAARAAGHEGGEVRELERRSVAAMRGLLRAMMAQADRVERFKTSQDPLDALHAKVDVATGARVVSDDGWGHLQLDATGIYLTTLAQMTAGGLTIVDTMDEVAFVQNLVWYVARAYRTPDFGIWERGDKANHGRPEINASSVAACKAALESLDGLDLFGVEGGQASVVHVLPDDVARARITLQALLPRESASKETDAALLSAIGFPSFAVDDANLRRVTHDKVTRLLEGRYGMKRFLRDGHQTVVEEEGRLHYELEELATFEGIECEWPLFFAYAGLNAAFGGDLETARAYADRLSALRVTVDGQRGLPELYLVPRDAVDAERSRPGSQDRVPGDNVPLIWAESLAAILDLVVDGHLPIASLDPLERHRAAPPRGATVQVAFVADGHDVARRLNALGVPSESIDRTGDVEVLRAVDLARAYATVGAHAGVGLTGRPPVRLGSLACARIYRLQGRRVAVTPPVLDRDEFHLPLDPDDLFARLRGELRYLHRHWTAPGCPTVVVPVTVDLVEDGASALLAFVHEARGGTVADVPVTVGPLSRLAASSTEERIDRLEGWTPGPGPFEAWQRHRRLPLLTLGDATPLSVDEQVSIESDHDLASLARRLASSTRVREQADILSTVHALVGLDGTVPGVDRSSLPAAQGDDGRGDDPPTVASLVEEVYDRAGSVGAWGAVRLCAAILGKVEPSLAESVADLVTAQMRVVVGKEYSDRSTVDAPLPQAEIIARMRTFAREDPRDVVLMQEVLVMLADAWRDDPAIFQGVRTLRLGQIVLLLAADLARQHGETQADGYERAMNLPPSALRRRILDLLQGGSERSIATLVRQERVTVRSMWTPEIASTADADGGHETPEGGWWRWRRREGALTRLPSDFSRTVFDLLRTCRGIVVGDKLDRRNVLDARTVLAESTPGEAKFAWRVEHLLHKIPSAEYRQVTVEATYVLADAFAARPGAVVDDVLVLDVIVGHAVRHAWLAVGHAAGDYEASKAAAWAAFYELSPARSREAIRAGFASLLVGTDVAA